MVKNLAVGDILENNRSLRLAKVIEVNNQFGWFRVQYLDCGEVKEHRMLARGNQSFYRLPPHERADIFLKLENAGITDFWQD